MKKKEKKNLKHYLISNTKIPLGKIIDQNKKAKIYEVLEEIMGEYVCYLGLVKDFLEKVKKEVTIKQTNVN